MPNEKACTKCGETKPLEGFSRQKGGKGGRRSRCKECIKECNSRYRKENRNEEQERHRRYRKENRKYLKVFYRKNFDELRESSKAMAHKDGSEWSIDDDEFIMSDNGMSVYQKAISLGRTYNAVVTRRHALRATQNL